MNALSRFPLPQQWGHVGSEIIRARRRRELGDWSSCQKSLERTLLLLDQLIENHLQSGRRVKEICRLRELVADIYSSPREEMMSLLSIEHYCNHWLKLVQPRP